MNEHCISFMQSSLELCAALKMSNTQTQVKWARNPSWINSSDTPNTFNFSCDLFLLAQTALCCTAVHDVESTPVCDYIVLADWYQLEGGGTPLCRIFWTDTLRNFEKRFLSIKFVQLSKKLYIDVQIATSDNFHLGQLKSWDSRFTLGLEDKIISTRFI